MTDLVAVAEIEDAARRLTGVTVRTPLVTIPGIAPGLLIKPESLQPTGAFKLRGAYAAITAELDAARKYGVVAHSSGNHGHAVAYAAALLGVHAVVVVPETAPRTKTDAIERNGAELVRCAPSLTARLAVTAGLAAEHGYVVVPPFDDRQVIAGQGTIGLEIAEDRPDVDLVVVPVSGGGLISGIATAIRARCPGAAIVGVEPELAAHARDSLRRGELVAWPAERTHRTIADALRVEQLSEMTFAHIREYVTSIVTVTEDEMREAIRRLALEFRLVAEPGGAAATAACLFHADQLPPARTRVAILSGGNVAPAMLADIIAALPGSYAGSCHAYSTSHPRLHVGPRRAVPRCAPGAEPDGHRRAAAVGARLRDQRADQLRAAVQAARRHVRRAQQPAEQKARARRRASRQAGGGREDGRRRRGPRGGGPRGRPHRSGRRRDGPLSADREKPSPPAASPRRSAA